MPSRSEVFKTPLCRFSYVKSMFERAVKRDDAGLPVKDKNGAEITEQQCTLIFNRANTPMEPFERAILQCITAEWGEKAVDRFKTGLIRTPILAGDGKEARSKKTGEINPGLGADTFFIRVATRLEAPVRYKSQHIPPSHGDGPDQVKSGDHGFAMLQAYTWHNDRNGDGVSFGVSYLQKLKDGEPLGGTGGVDISEVYQSVSGTEELGTVSASGLFT